MSKSWKCPKCKKVNTSDVKLCECGGSAKYSYNGTDIICYTILECGTAK
jgi:phage FluMu protein Com